MSDIDRGIEPRGKLTEHRDREASPWPVPRLRGGDWLDPLRTRLGALFEREMEAGRGFLWLPVIFGIGILIYFALPSEPSLLAIIVATLALAALAWVLRRRVAAFRVVLALATLVGGVAGDKGAHRDRRRTCAPARDDSGGDGMGGGEGSCGAWRHAGPPPRSRYRGHREWTGTDGRPHHRPQQGRRYPGRRRADRACSAPSAERPGDAGRLRFRPSRLLRGHRRGRLRLWCGEGRRDRSGAVSRSR